MPDLTAPVSLAIQVDGDAVAAGSDKSMVVRAPIDGVVKSVTWVPVTTVTGADTNSRTVSLTNKGQSGAVAVAVASKAFTSGVNAPAFDETAVTLNATAANLVVAAGDVLSLASTHVGTGIADPGGAFVITFGRS